MTRYLGANEETIILVLALLEGFPAEQRNRALRRLADCRVQDANIARVLEEAIRAYLPPEEHVRWVLSRPPYVPFEAGDIVRTRTRDLIERLQLQDRDRLQEAEEAISEQEIPRVFREAFSNPTTDPQNHS